MRWREGDGDARKMTAKMRPSAMRAMQRGRILSTGSGVGWDRRARRLLKGLERGWPFGVVGAEASEGP